MTTTKSWQTDTAAVEGYILLPGEGAAHPFFPSARVLAGTASTGGILAVEEGVLEPGQSGPYRHYHPHMAELFYVLDGELLLQIGEQVQHARAGTFAFCPAGCVHAFRAIGSKPARMLIMAMPPGAGEAYFRELA
ncbi:MAG: cupin domain-containing protein, partial [Chloroflexota bacterium]|nr:cupin domain-containing protein [Chloroflexota bacterium]